MKKISVIVTSLFFAYTCYAQKVWGKDINTTKENFISFMEEKGYKKYKYHDFLKNCLVYENVTFADEKFTQMLLRYSETTDSIVNVEFFKFIPYRPKRYGNWESDNDFSKFMEATFEVLKLKYEHKYPEGKTDEGSWRYEFPEGGSITLLIPPEKNSVSVTYSSRYKLPITPEEPHPDI